LGETSSDIGFGVSSEDEILLEFSSEIVLGETSSEDRDFDLRGILGNIFGE